MITLLEAYYLDLSAIDSYTGGGRVELDEAAVGALVKSLVACGADANDEGLADKAVRRFWNHIEETYEAMEGMNLPSLGGRYNQFTRLVARYYGEFDGAIDDIDECELGYLATEMGLGDVTVEGVLRCIDLGWELGSIERYDGRLVYYTGV